MASVGFLDSVLGLTPDQISVMMAFYMALDGYGPAANVTGDGAIALVADRFFGKRDAPVAGADAAAGAESPDSLPG
jgi:Na+/H+-dicarboxylate symporter